MSRPRYSWLVASLLATRISHSQSHLVCFLHFVLTHRFLSKRETSRSLMWTSKSTMFSSSRVVWKPLEDELTILSMEHTGMWIGLGFSQTLFPSPSLLFGFTTRMQSEGTRSFLTIPNGIKLSINSQVRIPDLLYRYTSVYLFLAWRKKMFVEYKTSLNRHLLSRQFL